MLPTLGTSRIFTRFVRLDPVRREILDPPEGYYVLFVVGISGPSGNVAKPPP